MTSKPKVVILGGSIAGLTSAIGLARRGISATVIERDPGPSTNDGDEAFLTWRRRGVPQFRQGHGFSARSRNLLLEHAPDVVDRLRADGIEESNVFKLLAPPEIWEPDDDLFTGFQSRRPAFELALRRTAEAEPGVEVLSPARVAGIRFKSNVKSNGSPVKRVQGVSLTDGSELDADVVFDCGGRRSPVPRWLGEAGVTVPEDIQDCGIVYFTRHFRKRPESSLNRMQLFGARGELEGLVFGSFTGDHDTFGIALSTQPQDHELRVLRHNWAWEAVARSIPSVAPWIDEQNSLPLHDVAMMAGHQNVRRHYVVEGKPLVLGLLAVGDSLCTTNPTYGWGASMALTYAFHAVDAVAAHSDDLTSMVLAYDGAVRYESEGVYEESAAMDRSWLYRMNGREVPPEDREEMEHQAIIREGLSAGALRDPLLGRALLRRMNLIDRPRDILANPEVEVRAKEVREILRNKPPRKLGPDRQEVTEILAQSRPRVVAP